MSQQPTGIELRASHTALAFMLALVKPKISIDGQVTSAKWGVQFYPVAPGTHAIQVFYPWVFGPANKADAQITLEPGQVLVVTYKSRPLVFLKGKIDVRPWTPPAANS